MFVSAIHFTVSISHQGSNASTYIRSRPPAPIPGGPGLRKVFYMDMDMAAGIALFPVNFF